MIGAAKGYKVKLFLPENASPERKLILRAFGAELVLTSPLEGTDGAIRAVRQIVAEHPDEYFYPDQVQQRRQLARALRHDGQRRKRPISSSSTASSRGVSRTLTALRRHPLRDPVETQVADGQQARRGRRCCAGTGHAAGLIKTA